MTRPPRGHRVVATIFVVLALNAWLQVLFVLLGRSADSTALTAWQVIIGALAAATAWSAWRGLRWAPASAVAYGVVTAAMLVALPSLLDLEREARGGIWTGAAVVLAGAVWVAWYLARATTWPTSTERAS